MSIVILALLQLLLHVVTANTVIVVPNGQTCSHTKWPCLTYDQFLLPETGNIVSGSTIQFLPDVYTSNASIYKTVRDVSNLTFEGSVNRFNETPTTVFHCNRKIGFAFINVTGLTISGIQFVECGHPIPKDLTLEALLIQTHSFYEIPRGVQATVLFVNVHSLVVIYIHIVKGYGYGILGLNALGNSEIIKSTFDRNHLHALACGKARIAEELLSDEPEAGCKGGNVKFVFQDTCQCHGGSSQVNMAIKDSRIFSALGILSHDDSLQDASGLSIVFGQTSYSVNFTVEYVEFNGSYALIPTTGAMAVKVYVTSHSTEVHIINCTFADEYQTSLVTGGGVYYKSGIIPPSKITPDPLFRNYTNIRRTLEISGCIFLNNTSKYGGAAILLKFKPSLANHNICIISSEFVRNHDTSVVDIVEYGQNKYNSSPSIVVVNSHFLSNAAVYSDSVISLSSVHNISFINCTFENNNGSAIHMFGSTVFLSDTIKVIGSHSNLNGGAFALYSIVESAVTITSTIYFHPHTHVHLTNNSATFVGGAIFVDEDPSIGFECFYQIANWDGEQDVEDLDICITMENNSALYAGDSIYGGLDESCALETTNNTYQQFDQFDNLFNIINHWSHSELASDSFMICLCNESNNPLVVILFYESESHSVQHAYPGQAFNVTIALVGSTLNYYVEFGIVPGVVRAEIAPGFAAHLGVRQETQNVGRECTNVTYSISSSETSVKMLLSRVEDKKISSLASKTYSDALVVRILVNLKECPFGFQLIGSHPTCDCKEKLFHHSCRCNINSEKIQCPLGAWIGNYSNEVILHKHCPFDYCIFNEIGISVENLDEQCAFDRSGVLCGMYQPGLSLLLGTSKCTQCSNLFLFLLIPFALAGIGLVIIILACNLTVSVGTINGLIYFANIVSVNHAIFFPAGRVPFLSIFVAWLNLDLGIQTCFFDGMGMYAKAWLQFLFPIYIWIIVTAIITVSHYSVIASKLAGSNSVPVLATLFLLSFAKLLRTIITIFSVTYLTYPDGSVAAVWLYDGNVPFVQGRHIALFLMALLATLGFVLPYTLLLLLSPYLQTKSAYYGLRWVNKLKPFFDAYHAPYKDKFRNWTGIMLVVRTLQFVIFAFNAQGDPKINLVVILIFTSFHLLATWNLGQVYRNKLHNIMESFCITELGIFAAASLYASALGSVSIQNAITNSVVGVNFVIFILIMLYHSSQLRSSKLLWSKIRAIRHRKVHPDPQELQSSNESACNMQRQPPTVSYIDVREPLLELSSF